ncbi:MAG TPA: glycoside hydrolase family 2 TIM barrel-domain containing protein [Hanamia sp.]|nr:glycoside hydrolase family 2 TIM barrel-domain containing protein [Hanamia sp.]
MSLILQKKFGVMNTFTKIKIVVICSFATIANNNGYAQIRKADFDNSWKFKLDSVNNYSEQNINDNNWRSLNLPHDWSIEGKFSKDNPATPSGGALPGGIGWYRKTFAVPVSEKGKSFYIRFGGVYKNSEVWINGKLLGMRPNGYITFQYDLTPYLKYGNERNVIAVKADNSKQPNSRWYSGSGIFRNVWLISVNKLHVDRWGTFITTPQVSENAATVNVVTQIKNEFSSSKNVVLKTIIYNADGKEISSKTSDATIPSEKNNEIKQSFDISNPNLWSLDRPYLYKAISQVISNEKVVDTYDTKFGIRTFYFDADKGFFLNGKSVKILGVCDHHDLGALGSAINTRAIERQLQLLKTMGVNGIRTSHNPPAPELLDLADKIGFVVMDEAFDMWKKAKTEYDYHLDWDKWHKKDLEDQVLRDRNHPSVFIWSVGNEIPEQWGEKGDTSGRVIARELVGIVKSLDTTREIVTANNEPYKGNNIIESGAFDLIGYNYHQNEWAGFHNIWPGKKMIVTESTSALETRGYYELGPFDSIRRWPERWDKPFKNPNGTYSVSAYDNVSTPWGSTHEESVKALLKSDHVSGMYIWTGFDYLGEPTPYSWPARSSYFGIIDLAGFPKDVYYMYQSVFTNKPVLHIYPHWNWNKGDTVDVIAYYNNADEVELFLNNKSLGIRKKSGDDLHVKWTVPFEPGTLKAISRKNGKTVLTDEVKTAGVASKIILKADRNKINADGKDLSFITATIVDKNGVVAPRADNEIHFKINGAGFIAGVDNGSETSHESFKGNKHAALNGLALAILQSNGKKGSITLTATSEGLQPATVVIETK